MYYSGASQLLTQLLTQWHQKLQAKKFYCFGPKNFNDEDFLTVVNSHSMFASNNVYDERVMDLDQCCPQVKNPLNINW